MTYDNAPFV
jgi:hypothetical protein